MVIAVIGVLAALLLPALSRAKTAALSAACKSSLHQWVLGLGMYIGDTRAYPSDQLIGSGTDPWLDARAWYQRLGPYTVAQWPNWNGASLVPNTPTLGCPAYDRIPNRLYAIYWGAYGYNGSGVSGSPLPDMRGTIGLGLIPGSQGSWNWTLPTYVPLREGDVLRPSEMIAIGDAVFSPEGGSFSGFNPYPYPQPLPPGGFVWGSYKLSIEDAYGCAGAYYLAGVPSTNSSPWAAQLAPTYGKRHAQRFNVSFCDGHVENLRAAQLFDVRQDAVLRRWNRDNLPHRDLLP